MIYSVYNFTDVLDFDRLFYSFGTGEKPVRISDLRIITGQTTRMCIGNLVERNGICQLDCDPVCDGCHQGQDPFACTACQNYKISLNETSVLCVDRCPSEMFLRLYDRTCLCDVGHAPTPSPVQAFPVCSVCPAGTISDGTRCEKCMENTFSTAGSATCLPCPQGTTSGRGAGQCGKRGIDCMSNQQFLNVIYYLGQKITYNRKKSFTLFENCYKGQIEKTN